jgi:hypothetical protein
LIEGRSQAADRRQARSIFSYARALIAEVPILARLLEGETGDELVLRNGLAIEIATARTIRGTTVVAALADAGRDAVVRQLPRCEARRALERVPPLVWAGRCGAVGMPGADAGDAPECAAGGRGRGLCTRSGERSGFGAEFRSDISGFLDRELIESAVDRSVVIRPPQLDIAYRGRGPYWRPG